MVSSNVVNQSQSQYLLLNENSVAALRPSQLFFSHIGMFPGWNQYKLKCNLFGFILYSSQQFFSQKSGVNNF